MSTVANFVVKFFAGYVSGADVCNEFSYAASHHTRLVRSCKCQVLV